MIETKFLLLGFLFLLLFGPEKLPEMARTFGQVYRAFRLHSQAMTEELRRHLELETVARSVTETPTEIHQEEKRDHGEADPAPAASKPMALVLPRNSEGTEDLPDAPPAPSLSEHAETPTMSAPASENQATRPSEGY